MVTTIIVMIILGAVLGLGLGVADKFLKVEVDERVEKVTAMLPNYNCGGCGFPGCDGLAAAIGTCGGFGKWRSSKCFPVQAKQTGSKNGDCRIFEYYTGAGWHLL